jgi:hypothetical protein
MVEKKEEKKTNEEERFRYIGFDVYPEKPKKFWKDEAEEKKYLEEVKKRKPGLSSMEREYSLVSASVFSGVDRMVMMISSVLLIIAFILPWFSLSVKDGILRYNPFGYIGKLGLILGYSAFGGSLVVFFALIVLLFMFTSLAYGILSLVAVVKMKGENKKYHQKLKKTLRLGFLPLGLWLVLLIISMIGVQTPFLSGSGIKPLGENFNVIAFLTTSSYGLWLTLCCLIVNSFKANDL